jgi:hypothetical protein
VLECDSLGNYQIDVPVELFKNQTGKLTVKQEWSCIRNKFPEDINCPYMSFLPPIYLASKDYKLIKFENKRVDYVANFELTRGCELTYFPFFGFERNSTKLIRVKNFDPDTAIYCITKWLNANPNITIKLKGFTYHERCSKSLGLKRASIIEQKFVSAGIESLRIDCSSPDGLLISSAEIRKAKSKEEKLALETMNRRVILVVMSFDYDPKLKRRVEEKPKVNDEEGDD